MDATTFSKKDAQHNKIAITLRFFMLSVVMLNVVMLNVVAPVNVPLD